MSAVSLFGMHGSVFVEARSGRPAELTRALRHLLLATFVCELMDKYQPIPNDSSGAYENGLLACAPVM